MCSLENFQFYLNDWLPFFCVINSVESVSDKWCRSWARFNGVIVIHSFWLVNTIHSNIQDKIRNGETADLLKASIYQTLWCIKASSNWLYTCMKKFSPPHLSLSSQWGYQTQRALQKSHGLPEKKKVWCSMPGGQINVCEHVFLVDYFVI